MPLVQFIRARIRTGIHADAATDSFVYLGIGGREFLLDGAGDDFSWGSITTLRLGRGATVKNASRNDPQNPPIVRDQVLDFPVYLRMEPDGSGPAWNVADIAVDVGYDTGDPDQFGRDFTVGTGNRSNVWLGKDTGKTIYIKG